MIATEVDLIVDGVGTKVGIIGEPPQS